MQVHGGNLHDGRRFAMKIQYPGVARSIESDVDNLLRLINIANLLPKGLYVEQAAEVSSLLQRCFLQQSTSWSCWAGGTQTERCMDCGVQWLPTLSEVLRHRSSAGPCSAD